MLFIVQQLQYNSPHIALSEQGLAWAKDAAIAYQVGREAAKRLGVPERKGYFYLLM